MKERSVLSPVQSFLWPAVAGDPGRDFSRLRGAVEDSESGNVTGQTVGTTWTNIKY